jgi:hypothetical protein
VAKLSTNEKNHKQKMKDRTVVSAFALLSSLSAYYIAKQYNKDTTPMVMIGGFLGALVGEIIYETNKDKSNQRSITKKKK